MENGEWKIQEAGSSLPLTLGFLKSGFQFLKGGDNEKITRG
jgi:hypothetical protein